MNSTFHKQDKALDEIQSRTGLYTERILSSIEKQGKEPLKEDKSVRFKMPLQKSETNSKKCGSKASASRKRGPAYRKNEVQ